jgi:ArsR family transcriptional regulator
VGRRGPLALARRRSILETASLFLFEPPYAWLDTLPDPKDAADVIDALECIPPESRLPALSLGPDVPPAAQEVLLGVARRQRWDSADVESLKRAYATDSIIAPSPMAPDTALACWARAAEFGEGYVHALRHYHEVFFEEDESRVRPALESGLTRAQDLAERLTPLDLLEELSHGLRVFEETPVDEWCLIPSFWVSPLTMFAPVRLKPARWAFIFDARPLDASLVPGEVVPNTLLAALKGLSDPTRLRILRLLQEQPLTSTQLARHLRLRAPTVIHHLHALRRGGLVQLTEATGDLRYSTRLEALRTTLRRLEAFLPGEPSPHGDADR